MRSDMTSSGMVEIGIDTGGTFTDLVFRMSDGSERIAKVPSTPADPSEALLDGIRSTLAALDLSPAHVRRVVHGTTVATNAIIERKGGRVGLLTTAGFRDVLEIGRQMRRAMYAPVQKPVAPTFLVPRQRRLGVRERIGPDGTIVRALDEADVAAAADALAAMRVDAIAICFLFSFVNPSHERRAREIVLARHPGLSVSLSSEVDPEFREYERTVATAFDAYLKPVVGAYLGRVEQALAGAGFSAPFQIMQSRGGVSSGASSQSRPIRLVLSGPAAGVVAGAKLGEEIESGNLITVDVGGTSCDIALIHEQRPIIRQEGTIDGFPVRVPMVDVNAIGAGGGSIAWVDAGGGLRVGPQSAGSDPGPACYARGGLEPTVTDASLVLGYLDPGYFAGGTLPLDPARAAEAIASKIAEPLGLSVVEAALGIHRVVNAQMAAAMRLVSLGQGFDPRDFSLVAMGGAGAVHAVALAEELGIPKVIVPPYPGVMAASGLLSAPVEHEASSAVHLLLKEADSDIVRERYRALDLECAARMSEEMLGTEAVAIEHLAQLCYVGQSFSVEVPWDDKHTAGLFELEAAYRDHYQRLFHHTLDVPIKITQLKSIHRVPASPRPSHAGRRTNDSGPAAQARRTVTFAKCGTVAAAIMPRTSLQPGGQVTGPAVIEQADTTTVLDEGWIATAANSGCLVLTPAMANRA